MGTRKWIGILLMAWGGVGVLNQFFMVQALTGGTNPTAALAAFDPATMLKVANPSGASYTGPAMLTDAAIAGVGVWIYSGKGL
jgi:hypothetical protein